MIIWKKVKKDYFKNKKSNEFNSKNGLQSYQKNSD